MKTDIQIAQEAKMEHIKDVAARAGIEENELEFYGKYKAKISDEAAKALEKNEELNFEGKRIIRPAYKNVLEEVAYIPIKKR